MSLLSQRDETKRLYREELEKIKPHLRYTPSYYDFESLEYYLDVFDTIPTKEKMRVIEDFVMMVWHYKDSKKKGTLKKSTIKLKKAIENYQAAIRELHNAEVVDAVIFRHGSEQYDYNGENDFDEEFEEDDVFYEGFDINSHLWNIPEKLKENYLTNIEILKELDMMEDFVKEVSALMGTTHQSLSFEQWDKINGAFRFIRPSHFFGVYRPSKDNIKETLYAYGEQYNIPAYKIKSLIDAI